MNKYYIIKDNETTGPFTIDELAEQGITPEITVCSEGKDIPERAGDVEELKTILVEQTESPPPFDPLAHNNLTEGNDHYETTNERYRKLSILKFGSAVKSCLLKLINFKGRARRSEFWWLILAYLIVFNLIEIVMYFSRISGDVVLKYILFPLSCVLIVSATVRRLHDSGRSGLWIFLGFIPILLSLVVNLFWIVTLVANLFFIALLCDDSEKCENKYGPSPKYVDTTQPEQLLKLQNDKVTRTSSILFPIITFLGISLFQSYLLISSFFSLFGALFGSGGSSHDEYDPFDIELSDSVRYVNDTVFVFDNVDTTFLEGFDSDSIHLDDSLAVADSIPLLDSDSTSRLVRTITCNNCGNYVARTSRLCPTCGKNPHPPIMTDCFPPF